MSEGDISELREYMCVCVYYMYAYYMYVYVCTYMGASQAWAVRMFYTHIFIM